VTHRIHAFTDDALGSHDAVGLVAALHAGEVSVAEVVDAAIARAEKVEPVLNAIAHRDYDRARDDARDPRPGFFAGVPTWVKDNSQVAGMPMREGTDAWEPRPATADGDFARMFLGTGAIPLGKSRLSEFGFLPTCEHPRLGPVRCAWDPSRTAGASSAGSAAMVAAGVVPIAHANDGGGSIRIPAAVNGLVGLKPTRGRIPTDRAIREQPIQVVADGVVTRSVRDTAALMREAERIYRALHLPPLGDLTRPTRARLRVALQTGVLGRQATPEVTELTHKTAALLESLGHHVEEAELPVAPTFDDDFLLYWGVLALFLSRNGRRLHGPTWNAEHLDAFTLGLAGHAARRLHKVPLAIGRLRAARRAAERFYASYDVHLSPTLAAETPVIGHLDPMQDFETVLDRLLGWLALTPYQNVTGQPAISLPLAATAAGLPQGMMFSAAAGREGRLIELAYELEEASPFASIQA
jgi:amidase